MLVKRVLKGGKKRKAVESSDEDDVVPTVERQVEFTLDNAPTIDGLELVKPRRKKPRPEFYVNEKNFRSAELPRQFLDNFLLEFTDNELAAKRTVKTIYQNSGSFSYTYRSIEEAFFTDEAAIQILKDFFKALVSVADERYLIEKLSSSQPDATYDVSILMNYELLLLDKFRSLSEKLQVDANSLGWRKLSESVNCMFPGGLARDLRCIFSISFGEVEMSGEQFERFLSETRSIISKLKDAIEPGKRQRLGRPKKSRQSLKLEDCLQCIDTIKDIHLFLRDTHIVVVRNVTNCPESESLESIVSLIESELKFDDAFDLKEKIGCIKILLGEESCSCLANQEFISESDFCRSKFNRILSVFEEFCQEEQKRNAEASRRIQRKREAVKYILDMFSDSANGTVPTLHRNPFCILGISPKNCSLEMLHRCGRRLKTLLHPDTEHDVEWKLHAEKAFKEASQALERCVAELSTQSAFSSIRVGPIPPYASFIGIPVEPEPKVNTKDDELPDTVISAPTLAIHPCFELRCNESKTGSLTVSIDTSALFSGVSDKYVGRNRMANIYLHRPIHGDEPITIKIPSDRICSVQKVALPENLKSKVLNVTFEAVQPMVLGSAWKYFVGVQISGDRGVSLVSWKSLYVELSQKGRNVNQIVKLLTTFENASFINQTTLLYKITKARENSNGKAESEKFLLECIKLAQRWADEN